MPRMSADETDSDLCYQRHPWLENHQVVPATTCACTSDQCILVPASTLTLTSIQKNKYGFTANQAKGMPALNIADLFARVECRGCGVCTSFEGLGGNCTNQRNQFRDNKGDYGRIVRRRYGRARNGAGRRR